MVFRRPNDDLECGKCQNMFNNLHTLQCQHKYCVECLSSLPTNHSNEVTCPQCQEQHMVPSKGFPVDVMTPPNVPIYPQPQQRPLEPKPHISALPLPGGSDGTDQTSSDWFQRAIRNRDRFRDIVKNVLRRFVRDHYKKNKGIICAIFLVITFSRFVAGAAKVASDCDKEQDVAMYLFVKAVLGFIFWITFLVLGVRKHMDRALNNLFVEVYIYVDSLFAFAWLIVGMAWCFGNYQAMKTECPLLVQDWTFHFINFALFLAILDIVIFVVFIIYALYTVFDTDVVQEGSENE